MGERGGRRKGGIEWGGGGERFNCGNFILDGHSQHSEAWKELHNRNHVHVAVMTHRVIIPQG